MNTQQSEFLKTKFSVFGITVCILYAFFLAGIAHADEIKEVKLYKHFDESDGLTTKMVYSILQDTDGFMWLATDAGVYRYDGKTFHHFTVDDGLSDNEILQIYQDRKGRIWFLTLNGYLSFWLNGKIYNGTNTTFLKKAYLASSVATAFEDHSGKLWIGGLMSGLIIIDDTIVKTIQLPPETKFWGSFNVFEDHEGEIWYFYKSTMVNIVRNTKILLSKNVIRISHLRKKGTAYILNMDGIYKIENGNSSLKINKSEIGYINKITNMIANNDSLWLCTIDEGCYLYYNGKLINRYLENSSISTAMADREGNVWFTTLNDGVYLHSKNNNLVSNYSLNSGLSGEKILSITIGDDNSLWLGYNNGIIDNIIGNKKRSFDLKGKNDQNFFRILSLIVNNDTIWCGTDLGCYYITNNIITRVPLSGDIFNTTQYALKQLSKIKNGPLYASYSLNFLKFEVYKNKLYAVEQLDSVVRTYSSIVLSENNFLISSVYGLMEFSPGKYFRPFTNDTALMYVRILDMKFDIDSLLLLSTNNKGLFVLNRNKTVQHISVANGLSDNNCRKLFLDHNQLFISSGNGVSVLIKKNGKWEIERVLSIHNGLLSNNVNDITADENKLYLATDKGLSIINRQLISSVKYYTSVKITEIVTDISQQVNENNYSFNSDIPRILIRFSYPVFNPINKTLLKYRLKDNSAGEANWNTTTNNEVEFSSLSPGKYIFEIMPDKIEGQAEITSLEINIIPKWWQTSTSNIFALLLLSLTVLYIVRRRMKVHFEKRLHDLKQLSLIESERNRIASDMHDDIGADLTQISIWLNILKQKEMSGNKIIQKVSTLSQEVLAKMDQIIWALNSVHNSSNNLISYLHSFASESLESSDMILDFKVEENFPIINISAFQRRNVFLVMKELLHNTIKHSKAGKVSIDINYEKNIIKIKYCDDGKGFFAGESSGGLGLINMKKRMAEINSGLSIESSNGKGFYCYLSIQIENKNLVS